MIGFREVIFNVNESVGIVKLYVEFLMPDLISSDVEVEVTLSTSNVTAFGNKLAQSLHPKSNLISCQFTQGAVTLKRKV